MPKAAKRREKGRFATRRESSAESPRKVESRPAKQGRWREVTLAASQAAKPPPSLANHSAGLFLTVVSVNGALPALLR